MCSEWNEECRSSLMGEVKVDDVFQILLRTRGVPAFIDRTYLNVLANMKFQFTPKMVMRLHMTSITWGK